MSHDATIIIAAFNAADVLPRSIENAAQQVGVSTELIVGDDASRDKTADLLAGAAGIQHVVLPENRGPSAARNAAMAQATGDWLVVLDADDTMHLERVSRMIRQAEAANADAVLGNFIRVDPSETPIDDAPFLDPSSIDPLQTLTLESYVKQNRMARGEQNIGYLKPILRRSFMEQHRITYDETLRNSEDFHLILNIMAAGGRVTISPQPDYYYRVAPGSISHRVPPDMLTALLAADEKFARRIEPDCTPTLRAYLDQRRQNLSTVLHSEEVLFALKSRKISHALSVLAHHPGSSKRVGQQLLEAITKRLSKPTG